MADDRSEANLVPLVQRDFGDAFPVHFRPVGRLEIAQQRLSIFDEDFGVIDRDGIVVEDDDVLRVAPDGEPLARQRIAPRLLFFRAEN